MSIFSKIFGKKQASETDETVRVGGMEDFMTLIRVYYQSVNSALAISTFCPTWQYSNARLRFLPKTTS